MKAKIIGGLITGILLCVGISNTAKAQPGYGHHGRRGAVAVSLSIGGPAGAIGFYSGPARAYYPPPPPPCPPVYRRPYCNPGYYNGAAYYGYRQNNYYVRNNYRGHGAPCNHGGHRGGHCYR
jgi:hypothetical protein